MNIDPTIKEIIRLDDNLTKTIYHKSMIKDQDPYIKIMNAKKQLHCLTEPAIVTKDGGEIWFKENLIHRDFGPAYIGKFEQKFYNEGKLHSIIGPAYISKYQVKYYYEGKEYSYEDWEKIILKDKFDLL